MNFVLKNSPQKWTMECLVDALSAVLRTDKRLSDAQRAKQLRAVAQTAELMAECMQTPCSKLPIETVIFGEAKFKRFLEAHLSKGSERDAHIACRARLIQFAEEFAALEEEWSAPRTATKGVITCKSMIDDAVRQRVHTWELSDAWLARWADCRMTTCRRSTDFQARFRLAIRRAALEHLFPSMSFPVRIHYTLPERELPPAIRSEIAAIIWNMRREARLDRVAFRWASARNAVLRLRELCGYAVFISKTIKLCDLHSLEQLLNKSLIRKFVRWLRTVHRCGIKSIAAQGSRIENVMRYHPTLADRDFSWISGLVAELSDATDEDPVEQCEKHVVLYKDLEAVPGKIRQKRRGLRSKDDRTDAWLVMQELLMLWLVVHPWPSGCIRQCRIEGSKKNIVFTTVPTDGFPFALGPALRKALKENPRLEFWQYYFSPAEVGERMVARGSVDSRLTSLLTLYVNKYRRVLVEGTNAQTLFVNRAGNELTHSGDFAQLVGEICEEHVGVWLTPQEIRRIYGFEWLANHKSDPCRYEKLAVILWVGLPHVMEEFKRGKVRVLRRNSPRRRLQGSIGAQAASTFAAKKRNARKDKQPLPPYFLSVA